MYSLAFLKGAAERAVKTCFQSVAAIAGAGGMGWVDVGVVQILTIGGLAALASFVTSMSNPEFVSGAPKLDDALIVDGEHLKEQLQDFLDTETSMSVIELRGAEATQIADAVYKAQGDA